MHKIATLLAASAAAVLLSGCTPAEVQLAQIAADERIATAQAQAAAAAHAQAQAEQAQAAAQIAYAQAQSASAQAAQAAISGATMPVIVLIIALSLLAALALVLAFLLFAGWQAGGRSAGRRHAEIRQPAVYVLSCVDPAAPYVLPGRVGQALSAPPDAPAWPATQPAGRVLYIE